MTQKAADLVRAATILVNQAAVLTVHCDGLGRGIDGNFDTCRSFIKSDIARLRQAISDFEAEEKPPQRGYGPGLSTASQLVSPAELRARLYPNSTPTPVPPTQ